MRTSTSMVPGLVLVAEGERAWKWRKSNLIEDRPRHLTPTIEVCRALLCPNGMSLVELCVADGCSGREFVCRCPVRVPKGCLALSQSIALVSTAHHALRGGVAPSIWRPRAPSPRLPPQPVIGRFTPSCAAGNGARPARQGKQREGPPWPIGAISCPRCPR